MTDFETPAAPAPAAHTPANDESVTPVTAVPVDDAAAHEAAVAPPAPAVDPVRAAAGRLGAARLQSLIELGKQYEREHDLTPGRQRLRQLVQLGRRYELEHGLRAAKPRRRRRADAWTEFVAALARVVKPAHRPAVEALVGALKGGAAA